MLKTCLTCQSCVNVLISANQLPAPLCAQIGRDARVIRGSCDSWTERTKNALSHMDVLREFATTQSSLYLAFGSLFVSGLLGAYGGMARPKVKLT